MILLFKFSKFLLFTMLNFIYNCDYLLLDIRKQIGCVARELLKHRENYCDCCHELNNYNENECSYLISYSYCYFCIKKPFSYEKSESNERFYCLGCDSHICGEHYIIIMCMNCDNKISFC